MATAIALGGPGAVFWMWITALVGMATKYGEAVLAVKYREVDERGAWVGGPMYYIRNGLGANWRWLGATFALFAMIAAFGIGNTVQSNSVADVLESNLSRPVSARRRSPTRPRGPRIRSNRGRWRCWARSSTPSWSAR